MKTASRGHAAAAAVLGLRKRPGLPSHPPPSPPPRGTRRGARLDLHPALLPLSVLLADPARRPPALAHTTHSFLPFRCSVELLGGGEGPRSRACGGRPLRRCAVRAGILVDSLGRNCMLSASLTTSLRSSPALSIAAVGGVGCKPCAFVKGQDGQQRAVAKVP
jgi:hypothetical protein